MKHELAGIRAWAYMMGMAAFLVAVATPALLAVASLLPPNLIWLCYLMPVVLASVRWGFASAAAAAVTAGLAGDFFFTQPYYSLYMEDRGDVAALLLFLIAAFGSALVITHLRQAKDGGWETSSAVQTPVLELSACRTSRDVVVCFSRWISVVARGERPLSTPGPSIPSPLYFPSKFRASLRGCAGRRQTMCERSQSLRTDAGS